MTWVELTENWAASYKLLQQDFCQLQDDAMAFVKQDQARFVGYLASSHGLTFPEAEDALYDHMARRRLELAPARQLETG